MNFRLLAFFSLALFVVQFFTSFTVAYLVSKKFLGDAGQIALWIVPIGYFVDFFTIVPLFVWLGRNQRSMPFLHAASALVLSEFAGFAILYSLIGEAAVHADQVVGLVVLTAYAIVGTNFGISLQRKLPQAPDTK